MQMPDLMMVMMIDDDVDDDVYSDARPGNLYIMMQCLCVTKNENFLTFCQGKI